MSDTNITPSYSLEITHSSVPADLGHAHPKAVATMPLGARAVVYGDIGTSPLYTMRECFAHAPPTEASILGVVSLIFWSLVSVVGFKYLTFVLRADNRGE